jgi:MoxR-like ATPase
MNETVFPFRPNTAEQLQRRLGAVRQDGRSHIPYVYSDEIVVAVNAALATRRPLLLRGAPGCGKSTVARDVAFALDRDFDEKVITSRTTATDLLWEFDAVGRLSDAAPDPKRAADRGNYIRPGLLWSAFKQEPRGIVVLIDEIDKADPDVPNDLLVPLGEERFVVTDAAQPYLVERKRDVLVIITTNGERELPPAFLRRCVALTLEDPSKNFDRLLKIAQLHLDALWHQKGQSIAPSLDTQLLNQILQRVDILVGEQPRLARRPGTAEILDAFKACVELGISADADLWPTLTRVLLFKDASNPDVGKDRH